MGGYAANLAFGPGGLDSIPPTNAAAKDQKSEILARSALTRNHMGNVAEQTQAPTKRGMRAGLLL